MTDDESPTFLPLGFSRQEHGHSTLSGLKDSDGAKCPECNEGYIANTITEHSSWGYPDSPATAYCKECSTKFQLGLLKIDD